MKCAVRKIGSLEAKGKITPYFPVSRDFCFGPRKLTRCQTQCLKVIILFHAYESVSYYRSPCFVVTSFLGKALFPAHCFTTASRLLIRTLYENSAFVAGFSLISLLSSRAFPFFRELCLCIFNWMLLKVDIHEFCFPEIFVHTSLWRSYLSLLYFSLVGE